MKRILLTVFTVITCFVLQGTLFDALSFANISPNLFVIIAVSFGLMRGKKTGLIVGFFSGLLCDIFLMSTLGFYALVYMYIGYFAGSFSKLFFPEDVKLPLFMIIASDLTYGFISYCIFFLLQGKLNIGYYFMNICMPECAYTVIVSIVLYPIILSIHNLLVKDERKRAKKFV